MSGSHVTVEVSREVVSTVNYLRQRARNLAEKLAPMTHLWYTATNTERE